MNGFVRIVLRILDVPPFVYAEKGRDYEDVYVLKRGVTHSFLVASADGSLDDVTLFVRVTDPSGKDVTDSIEFWFSDYRKGVDRRTGKIRFEKTNRELFPSTDTIPPRVVVTVRAMRGKKALSVASASIVAADGDDYSHILTELSKQDFRM
jgi:hypothetical protein